MKYLYYASLIGWIISIIFIDIQLCVEVKDYIALGAMLLFFICLIYSNSKLIKNESNI